jgi:membrane associated rhomboid family serine protease
VPFKKRLLGVAGFVLLLWLLELVDLIVGGRLDHLGIHPRSLHGLIGIALAPLLHAGFGHLLTNTLPLLVLGSLLMIHGLKTAVFVSLVIAAISGFGTWLIAPTKSIHIGASGLVFGWVGFLLWIGFLERKWWGILLSIAVGFFYGSILLGVLPLQEGISWQSHLFGALGGIAAAYSVARRRRPDPADKKSAGRENTP